ncbi:MAG: metallophosphoesterase [Candidatus Thermoplasmatota archaeon]|nr:metallophosphoesterase [Candidatus Thermoplasmatota archaeon]
MSKIVPIYNEPALLLNKETLVVADLHLGIELELQSKGINLPSWTDKILDKILKLGSKYKIKKLVILGDLKHSIPIYYQELKEVTQMIEKLLCEGIGIEIIPGNHDGAIHKLLPKAVKIHSSKGVAIDGIGLFHGHAYPSDKILDHKELITAHIHPVVALSTGFSTIAEPCWVKFKSSNRSFIIMPAFNKLCGCIINTGKLKLRPPLSKLITLNNSSIYLLDGTPLGKLSNLTRI